MVEQQKKQDDRCTSGKLQQWQWHVKTTILRGVFLLVLVMQVEIVEEFLMSILLEKELLEFVVAGLMMVEKFFLEAKLENELSETK